MRKNILIKNGRETRKTNSAQDNIWLQPTGRGSKGKQEQVLGLVKFCWEDWTAQHKESMHNADNPSEETTQYQGRLWIPDNNLKKDLVINKIWIIFANEEETKVYEA